MMMMMSISIMPYVKLQRQREFKQIIITVIT